MAPLQTSSPDDARDEGCDTTTKNYEEGESGRFDSRRGRLGDSRREILKATRDTVATTTMLAILAGTMTPSFSNPALATTASTGEIKNFPTFLSASVATPSAPYTGPLIDTSDALLVRLNSGVTYRDLREGTGDAAVVEGNRVNIQWVLKRSNGYSIDASSNNDSVPFIFLVGSTSGSNQRAIAGLDEGIRGMKVGGIRRIVIPPSLAYIEGLDDDSPGPVPVGFGPKQRIRRVMENRMEVPDETFLLDVKLTRIQ